jgi:hypothetical protein
MNGPLVSGIFVSVLLLLLAAGIVSGSRELEAEMLQAQRVEGYRQDAHLAHYRQHLADLRIDDRRDCR